MTLEKIKQQTVLHVMPFMVTRSGRDIAASSCDLLLSFLWLFYLHTFRLRLVAYIDARFWLSGKLQALAPQFSLCVQWTTLCWLNCHTDSYRGTVADVCQWIWSDRLLPASPCQCILLSVTFLLMTWVSFTDVLSVTVSCCVFTFCLHGCVSLIV